ncbi:hypothetical protein SBRCBS47491_009827 [Sporothrix bragantina]|uniref:galacturonan 1,4-alpha-galacturonidase n=1 Tax=Sporothrix bragantina TaxID=671064 RepID=A0ABP0CXX5_9PEZI
MHFPTAALALLAGLQQVAAHAGSPPAAPYVVPGPKTPHGFQLPQPGHRAKKICTVPANMKDAGPSILRAAHECNNGGTVYFPSGSSYTIASALDLTFLKNIDFAILGTIYFSDDIGIWPSQTFNYPYQTASLFWRFGGSNVRIYGLGKGVIDGLGQTYWTAMVTDSSVERPILFGTDGLHDSSISGINMRNPPGWFNFISNSTNVIITDMNLTNTDGWDTYRSSNIVIQNSVIVNTDDCVSFKPNSTSIVVQNLSCTGSHGISVGSLGQYEGEVDIVEDIYVYNNSMTSCSDGGRIKIWPGAAAGSGSSSGGGSGYVRNITYEKMTVHNNDQVVALTQCYGVSDQSVCNEYPDILFDDMSGVMSTKYDPVAGYLICSSPTSVLTLSQVCSNVVAKNIAVTEPSGKNATFTCTNMDDTLLELNCVS